MKVEIVFVDSDALVDFIREVTQNTRITEMSLNPALGIVTLNDCSQDVISLLERMDSSRVKHVAVISDRVKELYVSVGSKIDRVYNLYLTRRDGECMMAVCSSVDVIVDILKNISSRVNGGRDDDGLSKRKRAIDEGEMM